MGIQVHKIKVIAIFLLIAAFSCPLYAQEGRIEIDATVDDGAGLEKDNAAKKNGEPDVLEQEDGPEVDQETDPIADAESLEDSVPNQSDENKEEGKKDEDTTGRSSLLMAKDLKHFIDNADPDDEDIGLKFGLSLWGELKTELSHKASVYRLIGEYMTDSSLFGISDLRIGVNMFIDQISYELSDSSKSGIQFSLPLRVSKIFYFRTLAHEFSISYAPFSFMAVNTFGTNQVNDLNFIHSSSSFYLSYLSLNLEYQLRRVFHIGTLIGTRNINGGFFSQFQYINYHSLREETFNSRGDSVQAARSVSYSFLSLLIGVIFDLDPLNES